MQFSLGRGVSGRFALVGVGMLGLTSFSVSIAKAVTPDIPRIQAGAERGSIQEEIELAAAYFAGHGVGRDEKQAAYWYEKAANSGDPSAQLQIGFFYEAGIGVERNPARAAGWFERAMAGGSLNAKVNLGVAYAWGLGVRKDPAFAVQLFRQAAEKGSGAGACFLGDAYYFGIGVQRDVEKARHWFEVGAKKHDPQAQLDLALLLQQTDPSGQDRAVRLLRDAAAAGSVAAKHQLALTLVRKSSIASTPEEAIEQLQDASSQGFWKSSVVLGALYRDGRGVPKDMEKAYLHFRIASLQGGDRGAKMVQNDMRALIPVLGASRTGELDVQAADWMSNHTRRLQFVRYPSSDKSLPNFALAYPEDGLHAGRLFPLDDSEYIGGEESQP